MTAGQVDTTYESYAQDEGYITANRALVAGIEMGGVARVADLACGTGLMSRLLRERAPGLSICGIDLDPVQVGLATRDLTADGAQLAGSLDDWRARPGLIHLRVASAMELPFGDAEIDLVIIGNAIHMMPDRAAFLAEVARVLRPGGQLVFNSVFYAGTFATGTESIFTECMKEAVIALNEMNAARRAAGEPPIPRKRGTTARAFQQTDWLTQDGWADAVQAGGALRVVAAGQREMIISQSALEAIGSYGGLAEVLMSGYPVEIASQCMQTGIARAFAALGIAGVARNWLEMRAIRR
jgi:SAM-dependent methyltransferase